MVISILTVRLWPSNTHSPSPLRNWNPQSPDCFHGVRYCTAQYLYRTMPTESNEPQVGGIFYGVQFSRGQLRNGVRTIWITSWVPLKDLVFQSRNLPRSFPYSMFCDCNSIDPKYSSNVNDRSAVYRNPSTVQYSTVTTNWGWLESTTNLILVHSKLWLPCPFFEFLLTIKQWKRSRNE